MQFKVLLVAINLVLVASLIESSSGLNPEPRTIDTARKYQEHKEQKDINPNSIYQTEEEKRLTISEPYKTLLQTTARFAVAQSSLTDYMTIDTFMDFFTGTTYALSKPSILNKVLKALAVMFVTIITGAVVVPASLIQGMIGLLKHPERITKLERHLPNGLGELGIVKMLHEKTDSFIHRLHLDDSTCTENMACQTGKLVRCTFPEFSKVTVDFIQENFRQPKRGKYFREFLNGFIDKTCNTTLENENYQPVSCVSNFIRSVSMCSLAEQKPAEPTNTTDASTSTTPYPKEKPKEYQTLTIQRAK